MLARSLEAMSLRRVPPNLLVGEGARDFAVEHNMSILPHDALITATARDRWITWKEELRRVNAALAEQHDPRGSDPEPDVDIEYEELARQSSRAKHVQDMHAFIPRKRVHISEPSQAPKRPALALSMTDADAPARPTLPDQDIEQNTDPTGHMLGLLGTSKAATIHPIYSSSSRPGQLTRTSADVTTQARLWPDSGTLDLVEPNLAEASRHDGAFGSDSHRSSADSLDLPSASPSPPPYAALHIPLPASSSSGSDADQPVKPPKPSHHAYASDVPSESADDRDDDITDTVGAIAVDSCGNIAAGSSSGGIGMKHRGRVGPAALVGIGTAVIPEDPNDRRRMSIATVCSGTGEHMATTMAAATCADRLYHSVRKQGAGKMEIVSDNEVMEGVIQRDFMGKPKSASAAVRVSPPDPALTPLKDHPSVRQTPSLGAIGILAVKKTKDGIYVYFAHNTDSFVRDGPPLFLFAC